ncbi:LytR C-terminal domain-containing protein [Actinomycetospora cinnamomea]|nr:LytR C-terminal domain-containing protein [Actinomycetospora cinnamomea]
MGPSIAPGAADAGPPAVTSAVTVRVYNNSTIIGLADRAADELRRRGWNVVEVGNYPYGVIPVSTVYFRVGTEEEHAARVLAEQFGVRAMPRFEGIRDASPGLILIATRDWGAGTG